MLKFAYSISESLSKGGVNPERLVKEIRASGIPVDHVDTNGDDCVVYVYGEAEQASVDSLVSEHKGDDSLEVKKADKLLEIDTKTRDLIKSFEYSGKKFSLSSLYKYLFMSYAVAADSLSYPFSVETLDNMEYLEIKSSDEMREFFAASVQASLGCSKEAVALKEQVAAAQSVEEVVAVEDARGV